MTAFLCDLQINLNIFADIQDRFMEQSYCFQGLPYRMQGSNDFVSILYPTHSISNHAFLEWEK